MDLPSHAAMRRPQNLAHDASAGWSWSLLIFQPGLHAKESEGPWSNPACQTTGLLGPLACNANRNVGRAAKLWYGCTELCSLSCMCRPQSNYQLISYVS